MVQRLDYINRLLKFKDANIIKILAGIRRCGKSTVLDMYKDILIKEFKISTESFYRTQSRAIKTHKVANVLPC